MRLRDLHFPDASGQVDVAFDPTRDARIGVQVIATGLDATGTLSLDLDGPTPVGVGVGTVPDLVRLNTQGTHGAIWDGVDAAQFKDADEVHLWTTILPHGLTSNPVLDYAPIDLGGDLAVELRIYDSDDNPVTMNGNPVVTTLAGQGATQLSLQHISGSLDALRGQRLRFAVRPLAGQIGDGRYRLKMTMDTLDPTPYLLDDLASAPLPASSAILQDQFGNGTATGVFVCVTGVCQPQSPGENAHFYHFESTQPGPFRVWTSLNPGSQESLNTTLKVFRREGN